MKNFGLPSKIEITPDQWVLGSLRGQVLNPSGDWTPYLPVYEPQAEKYETGGCTAWGLQNQVETLLKFLTGIEWNFSERYNYILAEIKSPEGQQPHITYESVRKWGLIDHSLLPIPDTYKEFITPKPMTLPYLKTGKMWLDRFEFKHEWVLDGKNPRQAEILKDAIRYSPVCISVTAWTKRGDEYVDNGRQNNHWVLLVKYEGDRPVIFDSYDHAIKILSKDHVISYAKGIEIKPISQADKAVQRSWLMKKLSELLTQLTDLVFPPVLPTVTNEIPEPKIPERVIVPIKPPIQSNQLLTALIQVESEGNDMAIGDKGLKHKAYGCLQIRQPYVDDVNRYMGTKYKAQDCLGNRELSIWMFARYMEIYAIPKQLGRPVRDEDRARIHNGGPNGWKNNGTRLSKNTANYWNKVKKYL